MGEEQPGKGLGVRWEGHLIYQAIYSAESMNTKFIPVLFQSGNYAHIPAPVQGMTFFPQTEDGYEDLTVGSLTSPVSSHVIYYKQSRLQESADLVGRQPSRDSAALAHDSEVRQAFPDGIYWLTVGQKPNLLDLQNQLLRTRSGK